MVPRQGVGVLPNGHTHSIAGLGGHRSTVRPPRFTDPRDGACTSIRSASWSVTISIRLLTIRYPRARYLSRSAACPGASTNSSRPVTPAMLAGPVEVWDVGRLQGSRRRRLPAPQQSVELRDGDAGIANEGSCRSFRDGVVVWDDQNVVAAAEDDMAPSLPGHDEAELSKDRYHLLAADRRKTAGGHTANSIRELPDRPAADLLAISPATSR